VLTDNPIEDMPMPARSSADGSSLAAGKLDRRTKEWRRRRELVCMFTQALGGRARIAPILASKIETAAELAVAAELCRAAYIAGDGVAADDVVRTANQAARAEKALGINAKIDAKPPLSLRERMMQEQQA
jgi:hypothetical protein